MPARDPEERRAIASIAALSRSASESGADRMATANRTWRESFNEGHSCSVCKKHIAISQALPAGEIARRGDALYRLHMRRLALVRTQGRRKADERLEAALEAEAAAIAADGELTRLASA
jgi:hypothetical protein